MTETTQLAAVMLVLLLFWPGYNLVLALFVWCRPKARRAEVPARDPLQYWIIIPALNEERVVANTVRSALALDGARTPVQVVVVDDGSDDGTPRVLAEIDDHRLHVLRRTLPDARRGKGEALNHAYRYVRGIAEEAGTVHCTIIGVIDGDGRGEPGMLTEISSYFARRSVGAVQCRVRIHNRTTLLAFLQDLEFGCVVDASQSLRDLVGTVGLGGNGQFVRLSTLTGLGDAPWSACLVEDLELGLRVHLTGRRIRYAAYATITQQGLVDVKRLLRQRTRWGQGNLQCLRYVPKLVRAKSVGSVALLEFLQYLLTPWLVAPMTLLITALMGVNFYAQFSGHEFAGFTANGSDALPALGIWLVALVLPGLVWGVVHRLRNHDEPLPRCLLVGLAYPAFLVLGSFSTSRALYRHFARRTTWAKTERLAEKEVPAPVAPQPVPKIA
ncbi:Glycosyltransferase, catalytic subunit of cellulose synthase and poly-beta-1,6-N-acetylglucosamine synthase [Lentzea jiangxiensis]|uniref:Glycosyltransferase, catalytic subunit of cellulose synthase and poly-beta-1,6-N-acetylglucosamine synthase n=2 Tax=Lentzea jiangxiensis TaxID=641025 RepID=A0A1H0FN51_9PSEU|nr:Glycosyltransferase, catalytic subunit of cellulose synthase and poly-beta-1,6-N-acetylglucosamine synthase [Lentzea jiangxiensis]